MIYNLTLAVFSLIFGLITGSFLNVCVYRIPAGKSIVYPNSACPSCGTNIKWYHNIPVFSYIFLLGRCAYCGKKISIRYPVVEMLNAVLYLAAFAVYGLSYDMFFVWIFMSGMIVISLIDIDTQDVYYSTVIPLIITGILWGALSPSKSVWLSLTGGGAAAISLIAVTAVFYAVTGKIGMGAGDTLIFAAVGTHVHLFFLPYVLLLASVSGMIFYAVAKIVFRRDKIAGNIRESDLKTDKSEDLERAIYFGPFLAFGGAVFVLVPYELFELFILG